MTTPTAPDWRKLVEAEGADQEIVRSVTGSETCRLVAGDSIIGIFPAVRGGWAVGIRGVPVFATPAEAIRAALDWLRAQFRREIAEREEALRRLGP